MIQEPELSFEELYRRLEETVRKLEAGDLSLAESLALFEEGTSLAEQCNALLDRADLRVRQLTVLADGTQAAEPFEGWQENT